MPMNKMATSWIGWKSNRLASWTSFRVVNQEPTAAPTIRASRSKERAVQEHRTQDDRQPSDVPQAVEAPLLVGFGRLDPDLAGRAPVIGRVEDVEQRQQEADAHRPHRPAMLGHPPERNAFQVTQEQRRVAHRRQAAAHVGDDEDEEDDMIAR